MALAVAVLAVDAIIAPQGVNGKVVTPGRIAPTTHHNGCFDHDGFRVTPCVLTFSSSNPGPFTVTDYKLHPKKKGSYGEYDTCSGIATIVSQGSSNQAWTITAGSNPGTCLVQFFWSTRRHELAWGNLNITNNI